MKIAVYIESLRTFTSGTPHRGMLKELIQIRSEDFFILILRKGSIPPFLSDFFNSLKNDKNWRLEFENRSEKINNLLALLQIKNHCQLRIKADLFLNVDAHFLGSRNKPQIITVHDLSSVKSSEFSSLTTIHRIARKFTISNGIRNADHIISISNFTKQDIKENYKTYSDIKTIHNGIDPAWFQEQNENNSESKGNYWVWYGGFTKRKNLKRLINAYSLLLQERKLEKEELPGLLFIGKPNDHLMELRSIVSSDSNLLQKVTFRNSTSLEELIKLVSGSKGLVFPSLYEGFGLPVIEAFSQGVPVYTSNLSSLPEIAGGHAVLINPLDVLEMKEGLEEFYSSSRNIDKTKLKEWAANFTYGKCAINYSKLIDQVVKSNE